MNALNTDEFDGCGAAESEQNDPDAFHGGAEPDPTYCSFSGDLFASTGYAHYATCRALGDLPTF